MKHMKLSSAVRSLADYAADLGDEILVLTQGRRPVAAVVPLKNVDWEAVALSQHPQFLDLLAKARADFAGRTLSFEEVERAVLPQRSSKKSKRPARRRGR